MYARTSLTPLVGVMVCLMVLAMTSSLLPTAPAGPKYCVLVSTVEGEVLLGDLDMIRITPKKESPADGHKISKGLYEVEKITDTGQDGKIVLRNNLGVNSFTTTSLNEIIKESELSDIKVIPLGSPDYPFAKTEFYGSIPHR